MQVDALIVFLDDLFFTKDEISHYLSSITGFILHEEI